MRLIRCSDKEVATGDLVFEEFEGDGFPNYAILSHTWDKDEVTFSHVQTGTARAHNGYTKITAAMACASQYNLGYIWIDTCCIDKSSSAELTEAINSMFSWYQKAAVCLVHLADLHLGPEDNLDSESVRPCRWFTRGWCLQELLAPSSVVFHNANWTQVGTKRSWSRAISRNTGISVQVLDMNKSVQSFSVAQRMSWAAKRQTTRAEDLAYCLMGIFGVHMPLLYGEGAKAFQRLQEEILRMSDDESIFAWTDHSIRDFDEHGLLADSPANFVNSDDVAPYRRWSNKTSTEMTNRGLKIDLPLMPVEPTFIVLDREGPYLAVLNCVSLGRDDDRYLAIVLHKTPGDSNREYKRIRCGTLALVSERGECESIYVRQQPAPAVEDLIYPLHYFRLRPPLFARKISVLDLKFSDPGPSVLDHEDKAGWIPSQFRNVFKIHKQAERLSAAILFKWLADDFTFVLLFGSFSDLEVGFCAFAWPAGKQLESLEYFEKTYALHLGGGTVHLDDTHELGLAASCSIVNDQKAYDVHMYLAEDQYTPDTLSEAEAEPDAHSKTIQSKTPDSPQGQITREPHCPVYSYEKIYLARPVPRRLWRQLYGEDEASEMGAGND